MKKLTALILACMFVLSALTACGGAGTPAGSGETDAIVAGFKTIGDVLAYPGTNEEQYAAQDEKFIYVFSLNGTYYRGITEMSDEESSKLFNLDYDDPEHDAKEAALLAPVKVDNWENLSKLIPPQEELDKLVGKTGQELLDDGWTSGGYNLSEKEFWMNKGPFSYTVVMDGLEIGDDFDYDSFNEDETLPTLTVKSVTFTGLGDAASLED